MSNANCASCEEELVPVFTHVPTEIQFDEALLITFTGAYGMFIDPIGEASPKALICSTCALALCEQHPWIERLLAPFR